MILYREKTKLVLMTAVSCSYQQINHSLYSSYLKPKSMGTNEKTIEENNILAEISSWTAKPLKKQYSIIFNNNKKFSHVTGLKSSC